MTAKPIVERLRHPDLQDTNSVYHHEVTGKAADLIDELLEALEDAHYAISNSAGLSDREPLRPFDYEDFCVWAEQWTEKTDPIITKAKGEK